MGDSRPPKAAQIDLVDSYAHRVREQAQLVLADPRVDVPDGSSVILRRGEQRLEAACEVVDDEQGRRLLARVPLSRLSDGAWVVRLRTPAENVGLGCRLLVQGDRPLVLLWGAQGSRSRRPTPHPRQAPSRGVMPRARSAAGRVKRALSQRAQRSA